MTKPKVKKSTREELKWEISTHLRKVKNTMNMNTLNEELAVIESLTKLLIKDYEKEIEIKQELINNFERTM